MMMMMMMMMMKMMLLFVLDVNDCRNTGCLNNGQCDQGTDKCSCDVAYRDAKCSTKNEDIVNSCNSKK